MATQAHVTAWVQQAAQADQADQHNHAVQSDQLSVPVSQKGDLSTINSQRLNEQALLLMQKGQATTLNSQRHNNQQECNYNQEADHGEAATTPKSHGQRSTVLTTGNGQSVSCGPDKPRVAVPITVNNLNLNTMIVLREDGSRDYAEEKRVMAEYEAWINGLSPQELKELAEEDEADMRKHEPDFQDPLWEP